MGLQKYRADEAGQAEPNGSVPHYTRWMGGRPVALVRNCPCDGATPRTVYVAGEPDTYFSIPARCAIGGRTIRGWLSYETGTGWAFHPNKAGG